MNIQHEIDQFIGAVARLRGVTDYINGLADSVEGLVAENAGIPEPYVNQMPTAAAEYPAPPAPAPAFVPTPDEMIQARDEAVASIAAEAQVPPTVWPAAPAADAVETAPSAASPAEEPAPEPEKKTGRRTNEELAAEAGVNLADVKKWKGGGRISKADIEEYAKISKATPPPANPFGGGAVPPQQAPVTPPAPPVAPQAAAVAPGQGAPQEWPAAGQSVATLPANPNEAYGNWPTVEGGFSASNPFGG